MSQNSAHKRILLKLSGEGGRDTVPAAQRLWVRERPQGLASGGRTP